MAGVFACLGRWNHVKCVTETEAAGISPFDIALIEGEPASEFARAHPHEGVWDESDYLALGTNHLVEFTDGCVEVLPMPKPPHQRIVFFRACLAASPARCRKAERQ